MPHPHDFALLNDLLDGRLAEEAAQELRRRIADEPELSAAWDDLQRMRESLRSLPSPAVPAGFLDGVRSRAGLSSIDEQGGNPPAEAPGSVFRLRALRPLRPWMLAAASLGVIAGVAAWLAGGRGSDDTKAGTYTASRPDDRNAVSSRRDAPGSTADPQRPEGLDREAGSDRGAGERQAPDAAPPASTSPEKALPAGTPGRFGGPMGSVPPGLRIPTDDPASGPPGPKAGAPQGGGGAETPSMAAGAPAPARAEPPPAPLGPAATPAEGARPEPGRVAPAGRPSRKDASGATEDAEKKQDSKRSGDGALAWARDGVDDVLVLRVDVARSGSPEAALNEARARLAVLRASLRRPADELGRAAWKSPTAPAAPAVPLAPTEPKDKDASDTAGMEGAPVLALLSPADEERFGEGKTSPEAAKTRPAASKLEASLAEPVLGAFVLDLAPDEWAALSSRALAETTLTARGAKGAEEGGADKAERDRTKVAKEAEPGAKPAPAAAPPSQATRVRILVVAR